MLTGPEDEKVSKDDATDEHIRAPPHDAVNTDDEYYYTEEDDIGVTPPKTGGVASPQVETPKPLVTAVTTSTPVPAAKPLTGIETSSPKPLVTAAQTSAPTPSLPPPPAKPPATVPTSAPVPSSPPPPPAGRATAPTPAAGSEKPKYTIPPPVRYTPADQPQQRELPTRGVTRPPAANEGFFKSLITITPVKQRRFFLLFTFYVCTIDLLFSILSTPLSQLDEAGGGCFTFWGYKSQCDNVSYTYRPNTMPCSDYSGRLQMGAAFSILNILVVTALAFALWRVVSDFRNSDRRIRKRYLRLRTGEDDEPEKNLITLGRMKFILVGLVAASFLFQLIAFSMTAMLYGSRPCQEASERRTTAYGCGFGLLLTNWCFTLLFLPPCIGMAILMD